MDPDGAEYAALVAALEDLARSNVGNVIVVQEIVIVGRST
jgi:ribonuclease HI